MKKQIFYIPILLLSYFFSSGVTFYESQVFAATATVEGTATIVGQQTFTANDGGEFSFESDGLTATFNVPEDFYDENLQLQVISNLNAEFVESHPAPSSMGFVGRVYHIDFFTLSGSSVPVLDEVVTVVLPYGAAQVSGFIESTLEPRRWTGSAWSLVSGFILDTDAKTVTFSTTQFSTFALFAEEEPEPEPESSPAPSSGSGGGGGGGIISTSSTNEVSPEQGEYPNHSVDSISLPVSGTQETATLPKLEKTESGLGNMVPAEIIVVTEIPPVVYPGKSFLVRGKTAPHTAVRVWSEWDSTPQNMLVNIFSAFSSIMTGTKADQLEPHYYIATVYADGSFMLEHPPIPKRNSGVLTIWAEALDEEEIATIGLSEVKSIPIQRVSNTLFEDGVVVALLLFVLLVMLGIWVGRKKISSFINKS